MDVCDSCNTSLYTLTHDFRHCHHQLCSACAKLASNTYCQACPSSRNKGRGARVRKMKIHHPATVVCPGCDGLHSVVKDKRQLEEAYQALQLERDALLKRAQDAERWADVSHESAQASKLDARIYEAAISGSEDVVRRLIESSENANKALLSSELTNSNLAQMLRAANVRIEGLEGSLKEAHMEIRNDHQVALGLGVLPQTQNTGL